MLLSGGHRKTWMSLPAKGQSLGLPSNHTILHISFYNAAIYIIVKGGNVNPKKDFLPAFFIPRE